MPMGGSSIISLSGRDKSLVLETPLPLGMAAFSSDAPWVTLFCHSRQDKIKKKPETETEIMVEPRPAQPTVKFIDTYCEFYQACLKILLYYQLFPDRILKELDTLIYYFLELLELLIEQLEEIFYVRRCDINREN